MDYGGLCWGFEDPFRIIGCCQGCGRMFEFYIRAGYNCAQKTSLKNEYGETKYKQQSHIPTPLNQPNHSLHDTIKHTLRLHSSHPLLRKSFDTIPRPSQASINGTNGISVIA